jgi:hypothetical protein
LESQRTAVLQLLTLAHSSSHSRLPPGLLRHEIKATSRLLLSTNSKEKYNPEEEEEEEAIAEAEEGSERKKRLQEEEDEGKELISVRATDNQILRNRNRMGNR